MRYEAQFETTEKTIIEVPLIGTKLIELPDGRVVDFNDPINDSKYGVLKYVKVVQVPDPLPEPYNPARAEAIRVLLAALARYPADDHQSLLHRNPKLKNAVDRDFLGVTLDKIEEWTELVQSEAEQREQERIRAIPPPTFSQSQLTKHFYHSRFDYGDLQVVSPDALVRWTRENPIPEWLGKCMVCGFEGPVTATTLLQMECKYLPPHKCSNPCR